MLSFERRPDSTGLIASILEFSFTALIFPISTLSADVGESTTLPSIPSPVANKSSLLVSNTGRLGIEGCLENIGVPGRKSSVKVTCTCPDPITLSVISPIKVSSVGIIFDHPIR